MLELREIEILLSLREQLHFGRAAKQLHISQSRVSQTLRNVEQRIGGQLFERTSRQVLLTSLGDEFIGRLGPLYEEMGSVYAEAVARARRPGGTVRLGFTGAAGGRYVADLLRISRTSMPNCEITLHEVPCGDLIGPLQRGEVDAMVVRLPIEEPDLSTGPVIAREARLLAVPPDHALARRASVSIEDAANETMFALQETAPAYWRDFHLPTRTPSGRRLRHGRRVRTCQEILSLVAAGEGVAPMSESVARYYAQPDVAFVPVHDLPAAPVALVWRTSESNARIHAVVDCTRQLAEELPRTTSTWRPTLMPLEAVS
ncbi:LysR family transcriptional regulator [Actinokineospora inagensis]|uniref:LysR family transcriptional regulator n=1 Tax=Actinokineospora inagensis TaxID=103730 RepID=UPI000429A724|nr:LysR family transcriptional regulator [Actinokineospora inagensis]